MLTAASIVFFGYLGFDSITMVAEEAKEAKKDIPRAVLVATFFCGAVYFIMALLVCGVASMEGKESETAIATVFTDVGA